MGLKDLLKSTVKRALGRGEAPASATAPASAPEARPTRSGSHPAPPPWRAAQAPVAEPVAEPLLDAVVAAEPPPPAEVEKPSGALPPGDIPRVSAPTVDLVLDVAPGEEAWAPSPEELAARRDEPVELPPPPAITPSASHNLLVELDAAPLAAPAPGVPATGMPATGMPATGMPEVNPDAEFKVHLINEQEGIDLVITAFVGEPVLDAADRQGLALPYSCRNGGCTICAGKLLSGEAEMGDQYVLEPEQIAAGFRLLCCAWVTSDATIITHQNDAVS